MLLHLYQFYVLAEEDEEEEDDEDDEPPPDFFKNQDQPSKARASVSAEAYCLYVQTLG